MKKARYRDFEELKLQNGREQRHKCCLATQSGITLVALVVTIVVLLILAGITITYVFSDNGILSQAQSAANKTDVATVLEEIQSKLLARQLANTDTWTYSNTDVIEVIEEVAGVTVAEGDEEFYTESGNEVDISDLWVAGSWHYDEEGNISNYKITLKIGDYVDYTSGTVSYTSTSTKNGYGDCDFGNYTGTWQVLGVDETSGQVLLISSSSVGTLGLQGQTGYVNCETELEYIGSLYANGTGASTGRSVTVEDINKITGYNPNNVGVNDPGQTGSGTTYGSGYVYEYGNEVTYININGYISYGGTKYPTATTTSTYKSFTYYTGTEWKSLPSLTLTKYTSTSYDYYPTTLTTTKDTSASIGISSSSAEYNLLFSSSYLLGSASVTTEAGYAYFSCRCISNGEVKAKNFCDTCSTDYGFGARPGFAQ